MAIAFCGGSSPDITWRIDYDDVAHTVTAISSGIGRATVVVEQTDGKRAKVTFAASGEQLPPIAVPSDIEATVNVTRAATLGTDLVVNNVTLKPTAPSKPGGSGGFVVVCAYYQNP